MKMLYETDRLIIRTLEESDAEASLAFYQENLDFFVPYDPSYPENFLSLDYQHFFIHAYLQHFLKGSSYRYYIFSKSAPGRIIGCVGFYNVRLGADRTCCVSYKLAKNAQHHGYACEAILILLEAISHDLHIHRVEADILSDNDPSIRLATRLGFSFEGIAKSSHQINGVWKDHARYALILD